MTLTNNRPYTDQNTYFWLKTAEEMFEKWAATTAPPHTVDVFGSDMTEFTCRARATQAAAAMRDAASRYLYGCIEETNRGE